MKKTILLPHNLEAYENVVNMWEKQNKVAVIQATGTGKSFIILRCLEDFDNKNVVVLSPSEYIFNQLKGYSDGLDDNVQTMTYQKLIRLSDEEIKSLNSKLIVIDEFHRCGAEKWGEGVNKLLDEYPNAKVLGTSATPIRYLDNERDMSDELFDGCVASELSLNEAIVRKILPMPIYVSALYTFSEEINRLKEKIENSNNEDVNKDKMSRQLDRLKKYLDRSKGVEKIFKKYIKKKGGKYIVFCKDKEHMMAMIDTVVGWFEKSGGEVQYYTVFYDNPDSDVEFDMFVKNDDNEKVRLLFCIDMLNEGVHVRGIDGVILLRPTSSPIIFYQQLGRVLTVDNNGNRPIIFDLVNNFSSIGAHSFLSGLRETRERLKDKYDDILDLSEFSIYDEVIRINEILAIIHDRLNYFNIQFNKLVEFKNKYGHCDVKQKDDINLYNWCIMNRREFILNKLKQWKIDKLNSVGFIWDVHEYEFNIQFNKLVEFKNKYDHFNVKKKDGAKLYNWCCSIRSQFNKKKLNQWKIDKLNSIGFIWDVLEYEFNLQFNKLVEFKNTYGHCNVKQKDDIELYNWCKGTRCQSSTIKQWKIDKLNSIGFIWNITEYEFNLQFDKLVEFKNTYGHCNVKKKDDIELYNWSILTRHQFTTKELKQWKIDKLNSIGFIWDIYEYEFNIRLNKLVEFKNVYGHCNVKKKDDIELYNWCCLIRSQFNAKKMKQWKIDKLNSIDFIWDVHAYKFNLQFNKLVEFKNTYGHCNVKQKDDSKLYDWCKTVQCQYKNNKLDQWKIDKLKSIGFSFES